MASRVEIGSLTIPAGTTAAAPAIADTSFRPGDVTEVELVIPDGCAGLVGVAVAQAHQVVIPATTGAWIVANDEVIRWPLDGYLSSGSWQIVAYNTDVYPHTVYARFLVSDAPASPRTRAVTPVVITPSPEPVTITEVPAPAPGEVALPPEVTAPPPAEASAPAPEIIAPTAPADTGVK